MLIALDQFHSLHMLGRQICLAFLGNKQTVFYLKGSAAAASTAVAGTAGAGK